MAPAPELPSSDGSTEPSAFREELVERYAERVAGHEESHPGHALQWAEISALICTGTELMVPPLEPDKDINLLIAWGQRRGGTSVFLQGANNQCHENAARLLVSGRASGIATGYALSEDGLWRAHSTGWDGRKGKTPILETTMKRVAYFSVVLSPLGSWAFALSNADMGEVTAAMPSAIFGELLCALDALHEAGHDGAMLPALGKLAVDRNA